MAWEIWINTTVFTPDKPIFVTLTFTMGAVGNATNPCRQRRTFSQQSILITRPNETRVAHAQARVIGQSIKSCVHSKARADECKRTRTTMTCWSALDCKRGDQSESSLRVRLSPIANLMHSARACLISLCYYTLIGTVSMITRCAILVIESVAEYASNRSVSSSAQCNTNSVSDVLTNLRGY